MIGLTAAGRSAIVAFIYIAYSFVPSVSVEAQSLPIRPSESEAEEVRAALLAMKGDPRGPFLRIRWFCADGTVQPPAGTPCLDRGGGVQHAEPNDRARRLAALDFNVGTILQAMPVDSLIDAARANYRLREAVVTKHLFEIDNGWVLRQARYYRGARQIEDEELRGKELLERILADTAWTRRNYLLASRLVTAIPHPTVGAEDHTHRIRNLASEIATLDSGFVRTRVKIHSFPSRDDLDAVESYLASREHPPELRERLSTLRDALRRQYQSVSLTEGIDRFRQKLGPVLREELEGLERVRHDAREELPRLATLSHAIRGRVTAGRDGETNLVLLDLNQRLQDRAFVAAQDPGLGQGMTRQAQLRMLEHFAVLAYGIGFLSPRELDAIRGEIDGLVQRPRVAALEYRTAVNYLARSLDWSARTVRSVWGPVYDRYLMVEPMVVGFPDAVVRGSTLLPFSRALDRLSLDADRELGTAHVVLGERVSQGVRGLNPGVALAPLDVLPPGSSGQEVRSGRIYVLPETTSDLRPVAGVLTLAEGNLLSHVQLLARNLGIPNASVATERRATFEGAVGHEVFYAVSPLGRVVIKDAAAITPAERTLVAAGTQVDAERYRLDVSRLRLDRTAPIPLSRLRAKDSGVVVGPKAANLGELAAAFPDRVAPGLALPFGLFMRHVDRPFRSERTVMEELDAAYEQAAAMHAAGEPADVVDAFMFDKLAWVRAAILELEWLPEVRREVVASIGSVFGSELGRGVFVRSDTNVEDLPQFSGAGLNLTVPHQRDLESVLASIKRVWTSPFSERAYLWRKRILEDQGRIYPSVLLQASVPSEKSGVVISSGLQVGGPGAITIATAEGVGGAVDGEDAETIVVSRSGAIRLLSQTKAPLRRRLVDSGNGGTEMIATERPDTLLTDADIRQLREAVDRWTRLHRTEDPDRVWDMEFGFLDGTLWLFQVRPFIGFRNARLLRALDVLDEEVSARAARRVSLTEVIP